MRKFVRYMILPPVVNKHHKNMSRRARRDVTLVIWGTIISGIAAGWEIRELYHEANREL